MSYTSNDNGFLHIGDIITLYGNADHSGYIYTMGIIDDRMFIRKNDDVGNEEDLSSDRFRDCLFRICNCYKYNAQKQYWHALQQRKEACQYRPHLEMPMDDWSHRTHKYTDRFIRKLKVCYTIL
ncbi:hypothetical protein SNEBB_008531 [Seison nebaliae]|nr:hypothetical protein SNEBB_008531 [Seison nebaliae]